MERHSNRQSMSSTLCDDSFTPITFCRCQSKSARILRVLPWLLSCVLGLCLATLWARQSIVAQDQSSTFWKETEFRKDKPPPPLPPQNQQKTPGDDVSNVLERYLETAKQEIPPKLHNVEFLADVKYNTTQQPYRVPTVPEYVGVPSEHIDKAWKELLGREFYQKAGNRGPIAPSRLTVKTAVEIFVTEDELSLLSDRDLFLDPETGLYIAMWVPSCLRLDYILTCPIS